MYKDKGEYFGIIGIVSKDNGKMGRDMVKEYLLIQIKINIVDGGHLERRKGKELMYMLIQE